MILPNELLAEVMKRTVFGKWKWIWQANGLGSLVRVNRRFRDIAYACPALWSKIQPIVPFVPLSRALTMSRNHPLHFALGCEINTARYKLLAPHTSRVETFVLGDYVLTSFSRVVDEFLSTSPNLEFSAVRNLAMPRILKPHEGLQPPHVEQVQTDFRRIFDAWRFPNASKLLMYEVVPPSGIFPSCLELVIQAEYPGLVNPRKLCVFLQSLPALTSLSVQLPTAYAVESMWETPYGLVISLPQLRSFSFRVFANYMYGFGSSFSKARIFLKSLRIPNIRVVDLRLTYPHKRELGMFDPDEGKFFLHPEPYESLRQLHIYAYRAILDGPRNDATPVPSMDVFRSIAQYCPALRCLRVIIPDLFDHWSPDPRPLVELDSLQTIVILFHPDLSNILTFVNHFESKRVALQQIDILINLRNLCDAGSLHIALDHCLGRRQNLRSGTKVTARSWSNESACVSLH
jgi:hypothetical protein